MQDRTITSRSISGTTAACLGDCRDQGPAWRHAAPCANQQCRAFAEESRGSRLTSLTTPVDMWMSVFHVNFLAPILLARGLFDELKDGAGTVVNVTSIVGSRVHPFAGTAYATSKAALGCLTRRWRTISHPTVSA